MVTRVIKDFRGSRIELTPISGLLDRLVASWLSTAIWLFGSQVPAAANHSCDLGRPQ
jgi:hypothetical protein